MMDLPISPNIFKNILRHLNGRDGHIDQSVARFNLKHLEIIWGTMKVTVTFKLI